MKNRVKKQNLRIAHVMVGFTVGLLLMGASPLAAEDDCKVMGKVEMEAFNKTYSTSAHVYSTTKIGSETFNSEIIYAAGSSYYRASGGKWSLFGTTKDAEKETEKLTQQNQHNANSKDTCRSLKDEPVNGEMAAVYSTHSETPKGKIDVQIWISKARGVVLRVDTDSDKVLTSMRYEYGNVKPPL